MKPASLAAALLALAGACAEGEAPAPRPARAGAGELYDLSPARDASGRGLVTRSASFENPSGAKGAGGAAASPLGPGRKGAPARWVEPGETVVLLDVAGPGTVRHVWMTTSPEPWILRGAVVRAWWDGQEHPSLEAPLGDLFGCAHGALAPHECAVHSVGLKGALNLWLPMPFVRRARIALENPGPGRLPLFYQVDFTQGDAHGEDVGRLHALFRRENPTELGRDFELLPLRRGRGRYLGATIGVRALSGRWWGEGEVKIRLDGDGELATVVGTGTEDYAGLSWGVQATPFRFHGASFLQGEHATLYRWHVPDPVYWSEDVRVTAQQIGCEGGLVADEPYLERLRERADDWCCTTFWYEAVPSAPLPELPDLARRTADLAPR